MKFAFALAFISLLLVAAACMYAGWAYLLLWPAIAFACVAAGYAGPGVSVFDKGADGKISPLRKVILLPYLLYASAIWHLYRLLSRKPAFHQINDSLIIGRRLLPHEVPGQFDHYVDLTAEFDEPKTIRTKTGYISLPILDAGVPSLNKLLLVLNQITRGRTYVHCAQGHGRTGLFTLALLIHQHKISDFMDALHHLQTKRPGLTLNREQLRFLFQHQNAIHSARADASPSFAGGTAEL